MTLNYKLTWTSSVYKTNVAETIALKCKSLLELFLLHGLATLVIPRGSAGSFEPLAPDGVVPFGPRLVAWSPV